MIELQYRGLQGAELSELNCGAESQFPKHILISSLPDQRDAQRNTCRPRASTSGEQRPSSSSQAPSNWRCKTGGASPSPSHTTPAVLKHKQEISLLKLELVPRASTDYFTTMGKINAAASSLTHTANCSDLSGAIEHWLALEMPLQSTARLVQPSSCQPEWALHQTLQQVRPEYKIIARPFGKAKIQHPLQSRQSCVSLCHIQYHSSFAMMTLDS